jgi:lipopolysaccharide export system protein LptA
MSKPTILGHARRPRRILVASAAVLYALAFGFAPGPGLERIASAAAQTTKAPALPEAPPATVTSPAPETPPPAPSAAPAATKGSTPAQAPASGKAPANAAKSKAPSSEPGTNPNGLLGFGEQKDGVPVTVEADNGIEWQDKRQVYIARGNAKAVRGDVTVYGQVLTAYYRKTPSGGSDIWRLEAEDRVKITTPTDTALGDHAVYDVDNAIFVLTGKHLRLDTPKAVITARDSLEYWQQRDYAVARGDALAVKEEKSVRANVLVAHFKRDAKGQQQVSFIEAFNNVVINTPNAIARGMYGNYNLDTSIARLIGGVKITRGQDQLDGECADVNLNTGVSRLFSCTNTPVRGLLVPKSGEAANPAGGKEAKP